MSANESIKIIANRVILVAFITNGKNSRKKIRRRNKRIQHTSYSITPLSLGPSIYILGRYIKASVSPKVEQHLVM